MASRTSFRRLAKVLIRNVHSQCHQQQFHDLRQSIAVRSRRRTVDNGKDFFWEHLEPTLQCRDGAQILVSISVSHADFLPFLRYPLSVTTRPQRLAVPHIPERRHSSCTI